MRIRTSSMQTLAAVLLTALLLTALLLTAGLSACGATRSPDDTNSVVRDSSGVAVVDNPSLRDGPELRWSLAPSPSLDIGALDGPEEYQFFRLRDAILLPDGRVAVVNAGTSEVRLYTADGSYVESWGGAGEGPGEFLQPMTLVRWPPDSVGVWDWQQRRVSVWARDGTYGRSFTVPTADGMAFPVFSHVMEDGRVVISAQGFPEGPPQSGLGRNLMKVTVLNAEGEAVTDLGEYRGDEAFTQVGDGTVEVMLLPFNLRSLVAPAAAAVLIGDTERFEFRYFSEDGSLLRIARLNEPRHTVTEADRDAALARQLADAPAEMHPAVRRSFEAAPLPDSLPAFADIVLDASGFHWIRIFRAPSDSGPERWAVLDGTGVLRGTVETPEGLDIYEIGADYVLGRATDQLDVEHVQIWPLHREALIETR